MQFHRSDGKANEIQLTWEEFPWIGNFVIELIDLAQFIINSDNRKMAAEKARTCGKIDNIQLKLLTN